MNKNILCIDSDYYAIQGLFRPLEREDYKIDAALSALGAYHKAQNWSVYNLIIVELIIPVSDGETVPELVKSWENQTKYPYVGIGFIKWLIESIHAKCPVLILSVVSDPITAYNLADLGLAGYIRKGGLLPSTLKDEIYRILNK